MLKDENSITSLSMLLNYLIENRPNKKLKHYQNVTLSVSIFVIRKGGHIKQIHWKWSYSIPDFSQIYTLTEILYIKSHPLHFNNSSSTQISVKIETDAMMMLFTHTQTPNTHPHYTCGKFDWSGNVKMNNENVMLWNQRCVAWHVIWWLCEFFFRRSFNRSFLRGFWIFETHH